MSNIAINYVRKKIVICPHRIGSSRLYRELESNRGIWLAPNKDLKEFFDDESYTIYGAVRHPITRFKSWFITFATDEEETSDIHPKMPKLEDWTHKDVMHYFDEFKITCHYDDHTFFQYMIWKRLGIKNLERIQWFEMTKLEEILEYKIKHIKYPEPNVAWNNTIQKINPAITNYLIQQAELVYQKDIKWYDSLKKLG